MTPTDAGERLLRHARRASAAMRAAEADLHALAVGEAGAIRVGTFQSVGVRLLPGAMRRYVERWPDVEVRLLEAGYDEELLTLLERGEIDLAFVLANEDPTFEQVAVLTDPFVLLAPADSDLARDGRTVRPREIAALPLIGYRRSTEGAEAFLRSRGLDPEVVFRSDEGGTVQGLVGAGIGYAVVPLLAVERSSDVAVLSVLGVPPRRIAIAWHVDRAPTDGGSGVRPDRDRARGRDRVGLRSWREHRLPERKAAAVKILTVVGNRPQFIKSAPLSAALREQGIDEIVVHTGQHWDAAMSQIFFEELEPGARPDVTLDLRTSDIATLEAALRSTVPSGRPDVGARLRGHELDARRRTRRAPIARWRMSRPGCGAAI